MDTRKVMAEKMVNSKNKVDLFLRTEILLKPETKERRKLRFFSFYAVTFEVHSC